MRSNNSTDEECVESQTHEQASLSRGCLHGNRQTRKRPFKSRHSDGLRRRLDLEISFSVSSAGIRGVSRSTSSAHSSGKNVRDHLDRAAYSSLSTSGSELMRPRV